MVGVQDLACGRDVAVVLGADVPRELEHGVQPRADPPCLRALIAGALQPTDLAHRRLEDLLGEVGGLDAGPVVIGSVGLALTELLADRGELLAQQKLSLALLHPLVHVTADALGDVELCEMLASHSISFVNRSSTSTVSSSQSFWVFER